MVSYQIIPETVEDLVELIGEPSRIGTLWQAKLDTSKKDVADLFFRGFVIDTSKYSHGAHTARITLYPINLKPSFGEVSEGCVDPYFTNSLGCETFLLEVEGSFPALRRALFTGTFKGQGEFEVLYAGETTQGLSEKGTKTIMEYLYRHTNIFRKS